MALLSDRQQNLLQLINQLNQNLMADQGQGQNQSQETTAQNADMNKNLSVNLPGFDMNAGLNLGFGKSGNTGLPPQPSQPKTIRDVLLQHQNEHVELTTPFGPVMGTLIAVKNDYAVLVENDGSLVMVPIDKIEQVSQM